MSKCPYCGFVGCYNSGFTVECANPCCDYFTLEQVQLYIHAELRRRILQTIEGAPFTPWDPNFKVDNPKPGVISVTPRGYRTFSYTLDDGINPCSPPPPTEEFLKKQAELQAYFKSLFAELGLS